MFLNVKHSPAIIPPLPDSRCISPSSEHTHAITRIRGDRPTKRTRSHWEKMTVEHLFAGYKVYFCEINLSLWEIKFISVNKLYTSRINVQVIFSHCVKSRLIIRGTITTRYFTRQSRCSRRVLLYTCEISRNPFNRIREARRKMAGRRGRSRRSYDPLTSLCL